MTGWIGVDLDGTLAFYDTWRGAGHIGSPIEPMVKRVKGWLKDGVRVKIFTARASVPEQIPPILEWLEKHGLPQLEVTNVKDFSMIQLWDDRCVEVLPNTGIPIAEAIKEQNETPHPNSEADEVAQGQA